MLRAFYFSRFEREREPRNRIPKLEDINCERYTSGLIFKMEPHDVKMTSIILVTFLATILPSKSMAASWKKVPPLEERIKDAKYIFVGVPVSENSEIHPDAKVDTKVKFRVTKKLKGNPGDTIEAFYQQLKPRGSSDVASELDVRPGMRGTFKSAIEREIPELVYVREVKGILVTSPEYGGGSTRGKLYRDEIEVLEKRLSDTKSQKNN